MIKKAISDDRQISVEVARKLGVDEYHVVDVLRSDVIISELRSTSCVRRLFQLYWKCPRGTEAQELVLRRILKTTPCLKTVSRVYRLSPRGGLARRIAARRLAELLDVLLKSAISLDEVAEIWTLSPEGYDIQRRCRLKFVCLFRGNLKRATNVSHLRHLWKFSAWDPGCRRSIISKTLDLS